MILLQEMRRPSQTSSEDSFPNLKVMCERQDSGSSQSSSCSKVMIPTLHVAASPGRSVEPADSMLELMPVLVEQVAQILGHIAEAIISFLSLVPQVRKLNQNQEGE